MSDFIEQWYTCNYKASESISVSREIWSTEHDSLALLVFSLSSARYECRVVNPRSYLSVQMRCCIRAVLYKYESEKNHLIFHGWEQILKNKYKNSPRVISEDFKYVILQKILHLMVPNLSWYHFPCKTFSNWTTGPIVRSRISI